jgi:uncharacterized protein (DUF849 family)
MNFLDGSLFPENQQPLIITAAPYAPSWLPSDFPEDIAVTMPEQIQKAVDCYNAGASVLHLHVRELDGRGSKRLSKFNELIAGVRHAVPDMLIQVGGSISFAPETDGAAAKWLSDDTRHMLAELDPKPDQVTVTVNTSQMNILEHMAYEDIAGTSMEDPEVFHAYKEMTVPAQPGWVEEHIRRLSAAGIQSAFQCYNINSFESVERLIRRGIYKGPLVMNWVAISGGMDAGWCGADGRELDAQRVAGEHDRHCDGAACALRHRGQPVDAGPQVQDEHGAPDRTAGSNLA